MEGVLSGLEATLSGPEGTLSALDNTLSVAEKVISRRTILSPSRTEYYPGWTEFSLKRREFTLMRTEFPPPWRDFTPERREFPPVRRELPPRAKIALLQRRRPFFARKMVPPWWMWSPQMPTGLYASHRTSGGMVTNSPSMQNGLPSSVTREPWARPAMRSQWSALLLQLPVSG